MRYAPVVLVAVAAFAAIADLPAATMTLAGRRTSSAASPGRRSILPSCPAPFDRHVLAVAETGLVQALAKRLTPEAVP
jgi:hypothetical protein